MDRAQAVAWIIGVVLAVLGVAACSGGGGEDGASSESAVAVPGRWKLPADVAAVGAKVKLHYDEAPLWTGTKTCSGRLQPGARKLGTFLAAEFKEIASIGGYACRRNTADGSRMSVHGTGRAMDIFIPKIGDQADNTKGDKVANWLVEHAAEIGIQLVIWDRSIWRGNGTNEGPYGGPHPHDDHIHAELTLDAGKGATDWFATLGDAGDAGMDDDDGGTTDDNMDAGEDPDLDAGEVDAAPSVDASAPPPPATADAAPPQVDTDAGSSDWEIQEGDDAPGDKESVQKTRPTSKRASSSSTDGEAIANSGCSTAPGSRSATSAPLLAIFALIAAARRRR